MTCTACAEAHRNPLTGRRNTACFECTARALAKSPEFFRTVAAGERTADYNDELALLFGVDEEDQRRGHEAVCAWAREIRKAKRGAQ